MASGYFSVKPIQSGCPFPYASSAVNASATSAVPSCNVVFTDVADDAGAQATAWRALGLVFTCSLLVVSTLEFVGFVQSHVKSARRKGYTRTTWAREWWKLRTFKARMMQALIALLAINVVRAIDPWGIFGTIPPEIGRAASVFSADANTAVLLLFDLSMSGVLLQAAVPKRRLVLSLLVTAAISLLTLFYILDGIPGRIGAICYALSNITRGIVLSIGGLVALLQSLPAYRRLLFRLISVAPAPQGGCSDGIVVEASAIRVRAARSVDAAAAPSLELSTAAAALASSTAPLATILEVEGAQQPPSVNQYGFLPMRSASDLSTVQGMAAEPTVDAAALQQPAPPGLVEHNSELYGVFYEDPASSRTRFAQLPPPDVDQREMARTVGSVAVAGLSTTTTGITTTDAAAGVIIPGPASAPRPGGAMSAAPHSRSGKGSATSGVSGGLTWVKLRLVFASAALYVVQMVVAGICFSASVSNVDEEISPSADVPMGSVASVYGKKHNMLVNFWIVPALIVLLTSDGHARSVLRRAVRRIRGLCAAQPVVGHRRSVVRAVGLPTGKV